MSKNVDFDLGFSPEQFSTLQSEDGTGFRRTLFGDYTVKIIDGEIVPTKNAKVPHNMLKVIFEVTKSYEERTNGEVGSQVNCFYGTANSPEYMQKRFKALCEACKVVPGKGGMKFSQLLGKQLDVSIVWEMSDSNKFDDMGRKKFYVNERLKAERPIGTPRPKTLNPVADSQKAARYLDDSSSSESGTAETPPWATGNGGTNGSGNGNGNGHTEEPAPSFLPENEVEDAAHDYRAIFKMDEEDADAAKEALIEAGVDPEGPVGIDKLSDEVRTRYEAKFPTSDKKPKLKPMIGKRQPRA